MTTLSPALIDWPAISVSTTARRRMCRVGVPTRTISSTAVGATPAKSSVQIRRWSGWSVSSFMPWLSAVRVGVVAGDDQQDREPGELLQGEAFAVDLGLHQGGGDVVTRVGQAVLGQVDGVVEQLLGVADELSEVDVAVGVARSEDHVGDLEHAPLVGRGDAHHLADDLQGERDGEQLDEVTATGRRGVGDDTSGPVADLLLELADGLGGEALLDDLAQPGVLGRVETDHRPEEVVHLRGLVTDHDARDAGEQLRLTADHLDVGVPDDRPEARPDRHARGDLELLVERDRRVAAQHGERGVDVGRRQRPEVGVTGLDLVERPGPGAHARDRASASSLSTR